MATYNGAKYVREQVASVLPQLSCSDELIVVDDHSEDNTRDIIQSFEDPRIRLSVNPQTMGVLRTFETGLRMATKSVVFLCDQDDRWKPNKVDRMAFAYLADPRVTMVLSDAEIIDGTGIKTADSWYQNRPFTPSIIGNFWKNRFLGCTMSFRCTILDYVLPFPHDIPMHDMWIGLLNQFFGKAVFIPEALMEYRRHSANTTSPHRGSALQIMRWRISLGKCLLARTTANALRA
jgi:glycosyltransferase involved in cell wall biosynthesis